MCLVEVTPGPPKVSALVCHRHFQIVIYFPLATSFMRNASVVAVIFSYATDAY